MLEKLSEHADLGANILSKTIRSLYSFCGTNIITEAYFKLERKAAFASVGFVRLKIRSFGVQSF